MNNNSRFCIHTNSIVLDPLAQGVSALMECVEAGKTIRSSQRRPKVISTRHGGAQWLECETSGTTGEPKVIRRTPTSWIASFEVSTSLFGVGPQDHYAVLGSIGHSLGLYAALEALHVGANLSLLTGQPPARQLDTLNARKVTFLYATPTQLRMLGDVHRKGVKSRLESVRQVLVGGGKLFEEDQFAVQDFMPNADISEFYGTSETSFVTIRSGDAAKGSVGRPYPGVELQFRRQSPDDLHGEVCVTGPYIAECYVGPNPGPIAVDGMVRTGEVGYQAADGNLHLLGRIDRMITVSDVNVFPEAIEREVLNIKGVSTCAVVTVDDEHRGNRIVCFIEKSSQEVDPSEIRAHCRKRLGKHHVPKEVRFIPRLPILPSGKPDMKQIQSLAVSGN